MYSFSDNYPDLRYGRPGLLGGRERGAAGRAEDWPRPERQQVHDQPTGEQRPAIFPDIITMSIMFIKRQCAQNNPNVVLSAIFGNFLWILQIAISNKVVFAVNLLMFIFVHLIILDKGNEL